MLHSLHLKVVHLRPWRSHTEVKEFVSLLEVQEVVERVEEKPGAVPAKALHPGLQMSLPGSLHARPGRESTDQVFLL